MIKDNSVCDNSVNSRINLCFDSYCGSASRGQQFAGVAAVLHSTVLYVFVSIPPLIFIETGWRRLNFHDWPNWGFSIDMIRVIMNVNFVDAYIKIPTTIFVSLTRVFTNAHHKHNYCLPRLQEWLVVFKQEILFTEQQVPKKKKRKKKEWINANVTTTNWMFHVCGLSRWMNP